MISFFVVLTFFLLLFLIGMRAWFFVKANKRGKISFWEAVEKMIHEDEVENKKQ